MQIFMIPHYILHQFCILRNCWPPGVWEEQTRTALIWPIIVSSNRPPKINHRRKIAGFFKGNLHSLLLSRAPTPLSIEMDSDNPSKWVVIIAMSPFTYAKLPQQPVLLYNKWEWSPSPFTITMLNLIKHWTRMQSGRHWLPRSEYDEYPDF